MMFKIVGATIIGGLALIGLAVATLPVHTQTTWESTHAASSDVTPGAATSKGTVQAGTRLYEDCRPPWYVVSSPNGSSTATANYLLKTAAISPTDIWAVGLFHDRAGALTLTEHWDGDQWSKIESSNVLSANNWLENVAVLSTNDVWAVGYSLDFNNPGVHALTLIEHWNGNEWSIIPSPNNAVEFNYLNGVATVSANDVWAVGYDVNGPLIEHWNGRTWRIVPSPDLGADTDSGNLRDIAAISTNDVWAIGAYFSRVDGVDHALIEHWNGQVWSIVPVAEVAAFYNELSDIYPVSANDIWVVGSYGPYEGTYQTLIEHWNGYQWSIIPSPNVGTQSNFLAGVAAISANNVWAVGSYGGGPPYRRPLTEHWDGNAWTVVPNPRVGDIFGDGFLSGIVNASSPSSPVNLWAVGYASGSTLVERYLDDFVDVRPADYFYEAVKYLYCHEAISGYSDGSFRPYSGASRGQLCKLLVLAKGWSTLSPPTPTFRDVPASDAFYPYIETAYNRGVISGYDCGTSCLEFRPGGNVSRGQLCKIIVLAEQWTLSAPPTSTFRDVPANHPFYGFIETAYNHHVVSGYSCGTGCLEFEAGNNVTRGQIGKIVYQAINQP